MMNFYKPTLMLSSVMGLAAIACQIKGLPVANQLLVLSLMLGIIFIIGGISDVNSEDERTSSEKVLWTVGFISIPWLAGLLYYYRVIRFKYDG